MSGERHGLWWLIKNEKNCKKRDSIFFIPIRPKDLVEACALRYMKLHKLDTLGNWNDLVEILADRISSPPGNNVVKKSLMAPYGYYDRPYKAIKRSWKVEFIKNYGMQIKRKCWRDIDEIHKRYESFVEVRKETIRRNEEAGWRERYKVIRKIEKCKEEYRLINRQVKQLKEILNGQDYNR